MQYRQLESNANLGTKPLLLTKELERHGYVVAAHDHANASLAISKRHPTQLNVFKP
jgi:hypothetical protein